MSQQFEFIFSIEYIRSDIQSIKTYCHPEILHGWLVFVSPQATVQSCRHKTQVGNIETGLRTQLYFRTQCTAIWHSRCVKGTLATEEFDIKYLLLIDSQSTNLISSANRWEFQPKPKHEDLILSNYNPWTSQPLSRSSHRAQT